MEQRDMLAQNSCVEDTVKEGAILPGAVPPGTRLLLRHYPTCQPHAGAHAAAPPCSGCSWLWRRGGRRRAATA